MDEAALLDRSHPRHKEAVAEWNKSLAPPPAPRRAAEPLAPWIEEELAATRSTARELMHEVQASPGHPLLNRGHPQHARCVREFNELAAAVAAEGEGT